MSPNSAQHSTTLHTTQGTSPGYCCLCTSVGAELTGPLFLLSEVPETTFSCLPPALLPLFNILMKPGKTHLGQTSHPPSLFLCSHNRLLLSSLLSLVGDVWPHQKHRAKLTRPAYRSLMSCFPHSTLSCLCTSSASSCKLSLGH